MSSQQQQQQPTQQQQQQQEYHHSPLASSPPPLEEASEAAAAAAAATTTPVLSSGSWTLANGDDRKPSVVTRQGSDETEKYHSVPESGDAHGIGLSSAPPSSSSMTMMTTTEAAAVALRTNDVETPPDPPMMLRDPGTTGVLVTTPSSSPSSPSLAMAQHQQTSTLQPMEYDYDYEHQHAPARDRHKNAYKDEEGMDDEPSEPSASELWQGWWYTLIDMLRTTISCIVQGDHRQTFVQASYLGLAAMAGTLLRIILAQLFGEECKNPGTVGWLASSSPLCVTTTTSTGTTTTAQMGGIIFADLPSNMLGSFIMGLLQDGTSLGLAIPIPIAWLHPTNVFQGWTILHLALKTGFCGSLTTFSSWNSEMVVMLTGTAATHRESQIWRALFGYIIGMETALGSYIFGRTVACWLHNWRNPALGKEAVAIRERQRLGYVVNPLLPPLERRFLPDLPLYLEGGEYPPSQTTTPGLYSLSKWRESTRGARRLEHPSSHKLQEFETAILGHHRPLLADLESLCRREGWDVEALKDYLRAQGPALEAQLVTSSHLTSSGIRKGDDDSRMFQWPYAIALWGAVVILLATLLATIDIETAYDITYRTMVYGLMFATPGALLRWQLGQHLNGKFPRNRYQWIPSGTLAANWLGSMISIAMIAAEHRLEANSPYGFWKVATFRAVKIGFCGCLTTVSTFVAEVHGMMLKNQFDRAYKYATVSLMGAATLSAVIFSLIVYTAPVY